MAHGTPILIVCHPCKEYSLMGRFSKQPNCPFCGKPTSQTTKDKLIKKYRMNFLKFKYPNFGYWRPTITK